MYNINNRQKSIIWMSVGIIVLISIALYAKVFSGGDNYSDKKVVNEQSHTYTSSKLGIQFMYADSDAGHKTVVEESGDTVFVYSEGTSKEQGQFVQVFSKDKQVTLKQAIEKKILLGYNKSDCSVQFGTSIQGESPDSGIAAVITFKRDSNLNNDGLLNQKKCPAEYVVTNGVRYFWTENDAATKFVFYSLGQYTIPSGLGDSSWQATVKLLQ